MIDITEVKELLTDYYKSKYKNCDHESFKILFVGNDLNTLIAYVRYTIDGKKRNYLISNDRIKNFAKELVVLKEIKLENINQEGNKISSEELKWYIKKAYGKKLGDIHQVYFRMENRKIVGGVKGILRGNSWTLGLNEEIIKAIILEELEYESADFKFIKYKNSNINVELDINLTNINKKELKLLR